MMMKHSSGNFPDKFNGETADKDVMTPQNVHLLDVLDITTSGDIS